LRESQSEEKGWAFGKFRRRKNAWKVGAIHNKGLKKRGRRSEKIIKRKKG